MVKRMISALAMALVALLLVFQPVFAAAPAPAVEEGEQHYGLQCLDGVCRAQLDLGIGTEWLPEGAWLTVMQAAFHRLPGNMGIAIEDDVTITVPTGAFSLADADLVLTLDETGKIATLRGSASAPVPTFGLLGDWRLVTPARVAVGYDRGAELSDLNAPLQAERRYFFIDAQAGIRVATAGMDLTTPAGPTRDLIVDLAQPLLYIDGQVTVHTDGQMAFIRETLNPLGADGWLPTDLPMNQSVLVHLQGQVGRGIEPQLTLAGEYRMDGGLVGKWLQIDATPLLAQGQALIGPAGLMLSGTAHSALEPEKLFESGAQAELYIPFAQDEGAKLTLGANVASPAMGVDHETTSTVEGQPGWLAHTGEAAWVGMQQSWNQVGDVAQDSYGWMSNGVGTGWAYTQERWCGLTGLCAEEVAGAAEDGMRVAAAE